MKVDLYFSFRSPYSYLILPRIVKLRDKYGIDINFKQVYPLAIREPEFFKGKNKDIKSFLLDQKFVSGIGNIYASEILFLSKINPCKEVSVLSKSIN